VHCVSVGSHSAHRVRLEPDSPRQRPHNLHETYQLPRVQLITPDDGHRRRPKHGEFRDKIKFGILDASCWLFIRRLEHMLWASNNSNSTSPSCRLLILVFTVAVFFIHYTLLDKLQIQQFHYRTKEQVTGAATWFLLGHYSSLTCQSRGVMRESAIFAHFHANFLYDSCSTRIWATYMSGWVRWGMGKYTKRHTDVENRQPIRHNLHEKVIISKQV
jgi:hypothetical protein